VQDLRLREIAEVGHHGERHVRQGHSDQVAHAFAGASTFRREDGESGMKSRRGIPRREHMVRRSAPPTGPVAYANPDAGLTV